MVEAKNEFEQAGISADRANGCCPVEAMLED